jgi:hypothetical protein
VYKIIREKNCSIIKDLAQYHTQRFTYTLIDGVWVKMMARWADRISPLVERLPSKGEGWRSNVSITKRKRKKQKKETKTNDMMTRDMHIVTTRSMSTT